jgi:hypothetical protein
MMVGHIRDSLRRTPKTPNTIPITPGTTSRSALITLSAVRDIPESKDSNRVRSTRNIIDNANKAKDLAPKLIFIKALPATNLFYS